MPKHNQNIRHTVYFYNLLKHHKKLFVVTGIILFILAGKIFVSIGNMNEEMSYNLSEGGNYAGELLAVDNLTGETLNENQEKEPLIHEVKIGDTIWDIANEHNVKKDAVLEINNLTNESILKLGQKIILSSDDESNTNTNSEKIDFKSQAVLIDEDFYEDKKDHLKDDDRSENRPFNYEVISGDTVSGIAEKYNLKINTILWANDLTFISVIKPGQIIILLPTDGVLHEIAKGETIGQIALMHKADIQRTTEYNNIDDPTKIYLGDMIIIPDGQPLPTLKPKIAISPKPAVNVANDQQPKEKEQLPREDQQSNEDQQPKEEQPQKEILIAQDIRSKLLWPTTTRNITQNYGPSHRGIDIANGGTPPIFASHGGIVEFAGNQGDWGNTILLRRDDGLVTRYSHASEIYVTANQEIGAGNVIGKVGNTGRVRGRTGLHLDFRVYIKGVSVNPYNYLK